MNDNLETLPEREEIAMLLPWYATGKLDRADTVRVETYLASHPEMSLQLSLIRDEREQTIVANEAIAAPSAGARERFMAEVERSAAGGWRALAAKIEAFFAAPSADAVRWAAAAAAVLIVVQAVAIGTLLSSQSGPRYETASGRSGSAVADGEYVLVRFEDGATASRISAILLELEMAIVEGPKPGNLYRVRLGPKDTTEANRDRRIDLLRQRGDLVSIVMPAQ